MFKEGQYYTNGRPIVISAEHASLKGNAIIGFSSPQNIPTTIAGVAALGQQGGAGGIITLSPGLKPLIASGLIKVNSNPAAGGNVGKSGIPMVTGRFGSG